MKESKKSLILWGLCAKIKGTLNLGGKEHYVGTFKMEYH